MQQRVACFVVVASALAGGCRQPYLTDERLDRGLVLVFTGLEGRGPLNEDICRGLNDGPVRCAIELVDWTTPLPGAHLVDLFSRARNHGKARDIADRIMRYRWAYPDRPVVLVGHSGGGAIAVWVAEAMPPDAKIDGIVLLAAALSPDYPLHRALQKSSRGIVSFHSHKDWLLLGAGTMVGGTMDGRHTSSAGRVGFEMPAGGPVGLYRSLFQIAWDREMARTGHFGGHLTSGARRFVARYVAPLVSAEKWDEATIRRTLTGDLSPAPPSQDGDPALGGIGVSPVPAPPSQGGDPTRPGW